MVEPSGATPWQVSSADPLAGIVRDEDSFRTILEATHDGVVLVDTTCTIRYVNQRLGDMTGRSVAELTGAALSEILPLDGPHEAGSSLADLVSSGSGPREKALTHRNGSPVWARVSCTPLTSVDGTVTGVLCIVGDITQERMVELSRIAQARRTQSLADFADALSRAGTDSTVLIDVIATRSAEYFDCTVLVQSIDGDGRLAIAALAGPDPERLELVREMLATGPYLDLEGNFGRAMTDGALRVWNDVTPEFFRDQLVQVPNYPAELFPFHILIAPLRFGTQLTGLLVISRLTRRPPFTPEDISAAEEIARRAALATSQASLFAELERRSIEAETAADDLRETVALLGDALAERQALANRLVHAQEEERRRIAGEIHDDSIQALAALGLRLQLLRRHLEQPDDIGILEDVNTALVAATGRLRNLLFDLRPAGFDQDLPSALEDLASDILEVDPDRVHVETKPGIELPDTVKAPLYRIAREALINVARHARADAVWVSLSPDGDGVEMVVRDDGVGFANTRAAGPGHLGLLNMRDLAELAGGRLDIASSSGDGTTVTAWIPRAPSRQAANGESALDPEPA